MLRRESGVALETEVVTRFESSVRAKGGEDVELLPHQVSKIARDVAESFVYTNPAIRGVSDRVIGATVELLVESMMGYYYKGMIEKFPEQEFLSRSASASSALLREILKVELNRLSASHPARREFFKFVLDSSE